jgi:hypothetical protein
VIALILRAAGVGAGLLALAPSVCHAQRPAERPASNSAGAEVATLSNLRTLTRWAYPIATSAVHEDPSAGSRVIGRLELMTGDEQAEPYLTLRSYARGGRSWILVPLPGRPNGRVGWVPSNALGETHVSHEYLRVNRETLHVTLFRRGRPIWGAPIGVGRPSLPTPTGGFYVTEKVEPLNQPFYGPYALATSAYSPTLTDWPGGGVVAIHGTDEPQLIPGRPSHGCIRLRNADIASLWRLVGIGTPIEIV